MSRSLVSVSRDRVVLDGYAGRDLRERLARVRLSASEVGGWERGVPVPWHVPWLTELLDDWRAFDVDAFQGRLDRLEHFRADIDGQ